ncbi:MAG TPA: hypothetical protein VLD39_01255 [Gammaproteobacteria bacterium]|nr:hypothetical protein [Gammaproteobacteria bacterium]
MKKLLPLIAIAIAACADTNDPSLPLGPIGDLSPGGIWEGTHSDGGYVIGLVTEDGEFHLVDAYGQGYGFINVDGDRVEADYTYAPYLGDTLEDGGFIADCTLSGTLIERDELIFDTSCTTDLGNTIEVAFALAFNATYFRDGNLATLAGQFDDYGAVLTIDENGVLFEQDPATGCVFNGEVYAVDTDFNAYALEFVMGNCEGELAFLNGTQWYGIGSLDEDNLVGPEKFVFGATTEVDFPEGTEAYAIEGIAPRL